MITAHQSFGPIHIEMSMLSEILPMSRSRTAARAKGTMIKVRVDARDGLEISVAVDLVYHTINFKQQLLTTTLYS